MHLEARTFSIACAKNYEYWFQFLQVIEDLNRRQCFELQDECNRN